MNDSYRGLNVLFTGGLEIIGGNLAVRLVAAGQSECDELAETLKDFQ